MNEHEKLKIICDEIRYENEDYSYMIAWDEFMDWTKVYETWFYKSNNDWIAVICNVREIIFTEDFMLQKLYTYLKARWNLWDKFRNWLLYNLDNPVDYIETFMVT